MASKWSFGLVALASAASSAGAVRFVPDSFEEDDDWNTEMTNQALSKPFFQQLPVKYDETDTKFQQLLTDLSKNQATAEQDKMTQMQAKIAAMSLNGADADKVTQAMDKTLGPAGAAVDAPPNAKELMAMASKLGINPALAMSSNPGVALSGVPEPADVDGDRADADSKFENIMAQSATLAKPAAEGQVFTKVMKTAPADAKTAVVSELAAKVVGDDQEEATTTKTVADDAAGEGEEEEEEDDDSDDDDDEDSDDDDDEDEAVKKVAAM